MSKPIIGVTVGTPLSLTKIKEKLSPVKTINGVAPDANGNVAVTPAGIGASPSAHMHSAGLISGGTFLGQVMASSALQTPSTYLLRNSKLSLVEETPTSNGEICWIYE